MPRWIWNPVPDLGLGRSGTQIPILAKVLEGREVGREGMVYSSHFSSLCPEIYGKSSRNQSQLSQWNYQAISLLGCHCVHNPPFSICHSFPSLGPSREPPSSPARERSGSGEAGGAGPRGRGETRARGGQHRALSDLLCGGSGAAGLDAGQRHWHGHCQSLSGRGGGSPAIRGRRGGTRLLGNSSCTSLSGN